MNNSKKPMPIWRRVFLDVKVSRRVFFKTATVSVLAAVKVACSQHARDDDTTCTPGPYGACAYGTGSYGGT